VSGRLKNPIGIQQKIIFCLVLALLGCSRHPGALTQVSLQLPSATTQRSSSYQSLAQAQSVLILQNLIVNITAADLPAPVFYSWSRHSNSDVAPTAVDLSVPSGSGRLIQVLAGYKPSSGGGYTFEYGDVSQDLNIGSSTVNVVIDVIGGSGAGEGAITGRYLTSSGAGPTGAVNFVFDPGNGKPSMVAHQAEIFNGWFDFFALQGLPLSYVMTDGTVLFSSVTAGANSLLSGTATVLVSTPTVYRSDNAGGFESNSPQKIIGGFFGPAAAGNICYNASPGPVGGYFLEQALATALPWSAATAPTATQAGVVSGGMSSCTGTLFSNYLKFNENKIFDSAPLGFQGPFIDQAANPTAHSQYVLGTYSVGTMNLSWQYLPGVISVIDGVEVFYRTGVQSANGKAPYELDDGIACDRLVSDFAFTSLGKVPVPTATASIAVSSSFISNQQFQAVVCPYQNNTSLTALGKSTYFRSAASYNPSADNTPAAVQVKLVSGAGGTMQAPCNPITIGLVNASSIPITPNSSVPTISAVSITSPGGSLIYPNANCTSVGSTSQNVTLGGSIAPLNYSFAANANSVTLNTSSTLGSPAFTFVAPLIGTINYAGPLGLMVGFCHQVSSLFLKDSSAAALYSTVAITQLDLTPSTGVYFYPNLGACQASNAGAGKITSLTVPIGSSSTATAFYMLATTASPQVHVNTFTANNMSVVGVPTVAKTGPSFAVTLGASCAVNTCIPLNIGFQSSGVSSPTTDNVQIVMSDSGAGTFWSSSDCTTTPLSGGTTTIFANSNAPPPVYFKTSSASYSISVSAPNFNSYTPATGTLSGSCP
jgi:hypothetical protein